MATSVQRPMLCSSIRLFSLSRQGFKDACLTRHVEQTAVGTADGDEDEVEKACCADTPSA